MPNFEYVVDDYIELTQAVVLQSAKPVSVGAQRRMDVMLSHLQMTGGPRASTAYGDPPQSYRMGMVWSAARAKAKARRVSHLLSERI